VPSETCRFQIRMTSNGSVPWLRLWIVAIVLFTSFAGAFELYWRGQGFRPNVTDSKDLWYFWRQCVDRDDGKVIVLLGTSRILADISIATMRQCLPGYQIIQLGLSGSDSSVGILQQLAMDSAFKGTVICELDTPLVGRSLWRDHQDYIDYRPHLTTAYCESIIRARFQDVFASLSSQFTVRQTVTRLVYSERAARPDRIRRTFLRETRWDFAVVPDVEKVSSNTTRTYKEMYQRRKTSDWMLLEDDVREVDKCARALESRGAHMVFLRAPSSGNRWALEQQYHAKVNHWDRFAAMTGGTCIHFRDVPEMNCFSCPDESHLDGHDSPRYTQALSRELERRGALRI